MDDEDGRCLLDVICDPQALNDFLHGSEKIDSDDLLDNSGDAASAFFEGAGLHGQEASGNPLSSEPSQPPASVDLDFLEDDILGSPGGAGAGAEQPCDILQQSLQEANITEQTLEAEAELDLGSFQLPALQPVVQAADGTPQIFSGGADLLGLQPPAVLAPQALVQPPDVVNKAISVQPFLQQVGLGNVTIQPLPNLPGLPNGSPGGALGLGPIQVVGQQVMAINQPAAPQLLAKPAPVAAVGGYIAQPEAAAAAQGAGLVIQKSLPAAAATTLNGSSVFGGVSAASAQPLAVTSGLGGSLVPAPNVIIHRTPTPIQPKPAGVLQQKLYQITPKPFAAGGALALPEAPAKSQQNLTFMAGKAAPNVVLQGFSPNVFKPPPPQPPALGKSMSVHVLNQGGSIVIPAQPFQGQNQFLLPGQLAGASAVPLPQPLSALPANVGGQLLPGAGQAHIIAGQGAGAQLLANPALPAQLLNQNLAGQLNLGPVLASPGAAGAAHILSAAPIQLQPGQPAPALFQMPVSLAGTLPSPGSAPAPTVIQGVTLAGPAAALGAGDGLGAAVNVPAAAGSPGADPGPGSGGSGASGAAARPPGTVTPSPAPAQPQPSPGLAASPEKILLGATGAAAGTAVVGQDGVPVFLQQVPQGLLLQPKPPPSSPAPFPAPAAPVLVPAAPATPGPASGAAVAAAEAPKPPPFSGPPAQAKPPGLKGPPQPSGGGKGAQAPPTLEAKLPLKKAPLLQPSKEACLLEQLHKHQGAVLQPELRAPFRSLGDALRRLLPYHVYQGVLPGPQECQRVDEEFEAVSEQLLRRTRAMLNKYRLLLLEESRRSSPSAEMVMIDRIFIQEEKTALALDRQLARDRPAPPPAPPKLLIKHGGGSPSVTWLGESRDSPAARAGGGAGGGARAEEEEALPARSRPPMMKTYEARSRIGLKLKIKQEAGLSKVIHNTALDPPGIPPGPGIHRQQPPPGKTYREINRDVNRDIRREHHRDVNRERHREHREMNREHRREASREIRDRREHRRDVSRDAPPEPPPRSERRPAVAALRREPGCAARAVRAGKGPPEEPSDGCGTWGGKRRRAEAEVDKASFSSDSPQDDSLSEHLQSAIDSILNLQQPRGAAPGTAPGAAPGAAPPGMTATAAPAMTGTAAPGTPGALVPPPSHNGGLGAARTCTR
ncbi:BRD4-interacting chromatin-remodeling complex-associated protein [Ammospiza caudacuta]|uniref:BRD4-interacting chromatin-remodeling complex-associated protein n=1 Tax=Ammospiza caudacuta TaxID=2857398 RepID=UPI0027396562|nr:BRD4-interacting chromatin-remodeling complex-associated protein [Ammospiza caudacuta]